MASGAQTPTDNPGIELDELDPEVRPADDLFRHVNGKWIARTEIPSDKARYGSFYVLAEEAEKAVRDIIEEARSGDPGTEERKIGDLFASFLDEPAIEARGWGGDLHPTSRPSTRVDGIPEHWSPSSGRLERLGAGGFVQAFVDNDPGDPERYLVFLEQGGLGLPDESYYREDKFADIRTAYLAHLERMFGMAGMAEPAARAERVLELETAIAGHHWDNVRTRDSNATYNPMHWAEVGDARRGRPASLHLARRDRRAREGRSPRSSCASRASSRGSAGCSTRSRLDAWRDWLRWQVIRVGGSLPPQRGRAGELRLLRQDPHRHARAAGTVEARGLRRRGGAGRGRRAHLRRAALHPHREDRDGCAGGQPGRGVSRQHPEPGVDDAGDPRARAREAREVHPQDRLPGEAGATTRRLEIVPDDLVANVRATTEFEFQRELGKIGKPIDRDEWFMTPQTINAYYNPGFNEIVFPAAILQYPFFDETRDAAANYGAIGAVIGHEIGHGFDDQGSQYDGDGRLTDWWTAADREAFEERTASLIAQYDALAPAQIPDHHVNGALTIGENIGDLGGLGIAWKAYLLSLGRGRAAGRRRADRRPAVLPQLGAGLAGQAARRRGAAAAVDRSALAE